MASGFGPFARRVQSELVLRTARGFYLAIACASLGVLLVAAVVAILAQGSTLRFSMDREAPAVRPAAVEAIAMEDVSARMTPPHTLRFVAEPAALNFDVSEGQVLGFFDAETPNQLAGYPDDFDVVGGEHAALFTLSRHPSNGRAGLRATAALAQQMAEARAAGGGSAQLSYTLRIVARDRAGQVSSPADVTIALTLTPPGATPPEPAADASLTDLQALSREIALTLDPQQTDVFFDIVRSAQRTPRLCNAEESPAFVAEYRRAFEGLRAQLRRDNLELFYRGVCDAWNAAAERAQARYASDRAAADAVIARNAQQRAELDAQKRTARMIRNIAFGVAATALAAFLTIALFLAFLAMEGHSKALREAVETLAAQNPQPSRGGRP
ncbi:MAG: hypothetical protein JNL81_15250 [Hyphomonadaceae bacterium]|nr:hypothetical protein [Hyphomonadaceae bacterium]